MYLQATGRVVNNVHPDQSPLNLTADLGLHCLQMLVACVVRILRVIMVYTISYLFYLLIGNEETS